MVYLRNLLSVFCLLLFLFEAALAYTGVMPLAAEQLRFYNEQGYLVQRSLLSDSEVHILSDTINRAINAIYHDEELKSAFKPKAHVLSEGSVYVGGDSKGAIARIVWVGAKYPELLAAGRDRRLLVPVSQILGSNGFDHLINQIHPKMPGDGVAFAIHRDIDNRRKFDPDWKDMNGKGSFVQTLIAIDSMRVDNGTIWVFEGSHKDDRPIKDNPVLAGEYLSGAMGKPVPLLLNPGDVVFFHPNIVHYSLKNSSDKPRRVFINGFSSPFANHRPYPGEGSAQRILLTAGGVETVPVSTK